MTAVLALILGVVVALAFGNPYSAMTKLWTTRLLALSVVGLGFGVNLGVIAQVGLAGIGVTAAGITLALGLGFLLGLILKTDLKTSALISVGTAICGGSAIAAVAPVIRAEDHQISIALGTVFILNAAALLLFPQLGHWFDLSERQFGLWAALAIHDTSSVVGASMQFGAEALKVGTTLKLTRALWIAPVALILGFLFSQTKVVCETDKKPKRPWFILGFILAAALMTFLPGLHATGHFLETLAKRGLVITLFLIGAGLSRELLARVGVRPFLQALCLWIIVASTSLLLILKGFIS
jgi:uncharacterized integral membrane protein (TIGR00698 family)